MRDRTDKVAELKRRRYISRLPWPGRVAVFLGVAQIWFEPRGIRDWYWQCERVNPWNPLTWIFITVSIAIGAIQGAYAGVVENIKSIGKEIKGRKWG